MLKEIGTLYIGGGIHWSSAVRNISFEVQKLNHIYIKMKLILVQNEPIVVQMRVGQSFFFLFTFSEGIECGRIWSDLMAAWWLNQTLSAGIVISLLPH